MALLVQSVPKSRHQGSCLAEQGSARSGHLRELQGAHADKAARDGVGVDVGIWPRGRHVLGDAIHEGALGRYRGRHSQHDTVRQALLCEAAAGWILAAVQYVLRFPVRPNVLIALGRHQRTLERLRALDRGHVDV